MIARVIALCLVFVLLAGLSCVSAETNETPKTEVVRLSANKSTERLSNRTLRADSDRALAIAHYEILLAKELLTNSTTVYVEWIPKDINSDERIALLANAGRDVKRPELILAGRGGKKSKRPCTKEYPCVARAKWWDSTSFYTRPGYAFLAMPTNKSVINVVVQLVQSDRTPQISTRGTFRVQVKTNPERTCGGRKRECHGRGDCERDSIGLGRCVCKRGYGGRFCEDTLQEWNCKKKKSLPRSTSVNVTANQWIYVRYFHCGQATKARFVATVPNGKEVEVYARAPGQELSCNPEVSDELDDFKSLPSRHDVDCRAERESGKYRIDSNVTLYNSGAWDFSFFSKKDITNIQLRVFACPRNGCDIHPGSAGLPFLILPICLCFLCVAAAVVCVLLYVDRRHGFVTGPDKLTDTELQNMCPEYTLLATDDPAHEEHKMCAVCLCDFQVGDKLRRLKCDHRFHSECIDPWLTLNNATCPTCREEARVPELSERRVQRAIIKYVLAPILRLPLRARSRRISPMSRMWRASQRQQPDTPGTPTDEGINYCIDEARDVPSTDAGVVNALSGRRISRSSDIELGEPQLQFSHTTLGDASIRNHVRNRARNQASTDEDVIAPQSQCSLCTSQYDTPPMSPPPPPPAPPDRSSTMAVEVTHDEDRVVQRREESGLSTSSYYTAPLNLDAPTATALRAQGILPHVRAALDPAQRESGER